MPESLISFIKGDKIGSETDYRDYLPINMTPVIRPMFGAEGYMLEVPGLTQLGIGRGLDRGANWNERFARHYRVNGNKFISVAADGTVVELGDVLGSDNASMPYSFETQGIVADKKFFLYDSTNGFRQVTDPDIRLPIDGTWINGKYCFTDGEFLYHTEIVNGTPVEDSVADLALATAEFSPDPTLGVGRTTDNKWIAFNRYSIEYLRDVGGETFSFQRLENRAIQTGLVATHAKAEIGGTWFFMGGPKEEAVSFYVLGTGQANKLATREIEKVIRKYSENELGSAVVESFEEDGYSFLMVRLPEETLLLNWTYAQTKGIEGAWSIMKTGLKNARWRGANGIFDPRRSQWIYGDTLGPIIGYLDNTSGEQYGEIQEWYLNTPFMYLDSASIDHLEIEIVPGFTVSKDATVFLSITSDGVAHTMEKTIEYGLPSDYSNRFIVYRPFGYIRDWFAIRMRGASKSRMAFHRAKIRYA